MPRGRPTVLTQAKQKRIAELIWLAYTDKQIAALVGVSYKTIARARNGDLCPCIQKIALEYEEPYRRKFWTTTQFQGGIAWMLERRYPTQFSKPEIQLALSNNLTMNTLSINITAGEAKAIEGKAEPVRASVKEMFARYRPQLENGNGNAEQ